MKLVSCADNTLLMYIMGRLQFRVECEVLQVVEFVIKMVTKLGL